MNTCITPDCRAIAATNAAHCILCKLRAVEAERDAYRFALSRIVEECDRIDPLDPSYKYSLTYSDTIDAIDDARELLAGA